MKCRYDRDNCQFLGDKEECAMCCDGIMGVSNYLPKEVTQNLLEANAYSLLSDVAIQEKVLLLLERLQGYLSSGETYCFDNQWDEADAKELKELIDRIRGNVT